MTTMTMKTKLKADARNPNRGTDRGRAAVKASLEAFGAGRSILAAADGTVIAGNKTYMEAEKLGIPVREIETDGTELVVVRRTDIVDGASAKARGLSVADNRAGFLGYDLDPIILGEILEMPEAGVELFFEPVELVEMGMEAGGGPASPNDGQIDLGEGTIAGTATLDKVTVFFLKSKARSARTALATLAKEYGGTIIG